MSSRLTINFCNKAVIFNCFSHEWLLQYLKGNNEMTKVHQVCTKLFFPFKTRCLLLRQAKVQYSKATSKQLGQRIRTMKFFTFANQLTIVAATKRSLKLGILGTCDPQFALAASFNP